MQISIFFVKFENHLKQSKTVMIRAMIILNYDICIPQTSLQKNCVRNANIKFICKIHLSEKPGSKPSCNIFPSWVFFIQIYVKRTWAKIILKYYKCIPKTSRQHFYVRNAYMKCISEMFEWNHLEILAVSQQKLWTGATVMLRFIFANFSQA